MNTKMLITICLAIFFDEEFSSRKKLIQIGRNTVIVYYKNSYLGYALPQEVIFSHTQKWRTLNPRTV